MIRGGRPLRFLLLVMGAWSGVRVWLLRSTAPPRPQAVRATVSPARLARRMASVPIEPVYHPRLALMARARRSEPVWRPRPAARVADGNEAEARSATETSVAVVQASPLRFGDPVPDLVPLAIAAKPPPTGSRLSGSAWLLARGGPALAGGLAGAQLGGSQAGVRLALAVDRARRVAIVGRLTSAIGGSGASRFLSDREGAVGLAWRPSRLPVTLVAEQRFVFESGGHGGPTIGVIAGLPPTPIVAGFRLESYGQAGAIARSGAGNGVEAFGDGAARLTRPVTLGPLRLDIGAGAWGGAQRGASRLDVGPTLGASVPVAGHGLRLTLDWRTRITGDARPGSGPALSLGTDF